MYNSVQEKYGHYNIAWLHMSRVCNKNRSMFTVGTFPNLPHLGLNTFNIYFVFKIKQSMHTQPSIIILQHYIKMIIAVHILLFDDRC